MALKQDRRFVIERISISEGTLFDGYAMHIQRYQFAAEYCAGKRVLDAGCGTGYGSASLAKDAGSQSVIAVDISEQALAEAKQYYSRSNLKFIHGDVENLSAISELEAGVDTVVNLENIEHLQNPSRFLQEVRQVLSDDGCLVVSSPNGQLTEFDAHGQISNKFHLQEYTVEEFDKLLRSAFGTIQFFGQWLTPEGKAHMQLHREMFEMLTELYYNPLVRLGRMIKRSFGKKCAAPPVYHAGQSYSWQYTIGPLDQAPFSWPPAYLLAVCWP